ncbi:MAG: glycosyltransferase [Erysipelotrichales bacterium]|nr:glycosyltransferase [Erysipelotrichales bacterium]
MTNKQNYSVLMSVYFKEKPEHLKMSVQSMLNQTIKPNEIIIVCDGPLTKELDDTLETLSKENSCIHLIRLPENGGLGNALRIGLDACSNEFVLRMDSDDYSIPTRAERQLVELENCDIVGGNIIEFVDELDNTIGMRVVPTEQKDIVKFSKKRSPFSHPSVAFRKSAVQNCGGYLDMLYVEDYYLWIRMIQSGARCKNIDECLVYMRSGIDMRKRRAGKIFNHSLRQLRKYMLKTKYINWLQYCVYTTEGTILCHLPVKLKEKVFKVFLRKKVNKESK